MAHALAARLAGLARFGLRPGTERVRFLLRALGDPHLAYGTVHVAGTAGKGSAAALLASIFQAAGHRTGLYTSPHLVSFGERMRVDGRAAGDHEVEGLLDAVWPLVGRAAAEAGVGPPTQFDVVTAMAFLHFARAGVRWAVVEVGLGGTWDSTNVLAPAACIVTPVGRDHTDVLGDSLAEIARAKAGILRPGVPALLGAQPPDALAVLEEAARERGSPLWRLGREIRVSPRAPSRRGTSFDLFLPGGETLAGLHVSLLGLHQVDNAALAAAAAVRVRSGGCPVPAAAVRLGLALCSWPGRLEVAGRRPLVLLDGAHNSPGARALADALGALFPERPAVLLFGMQGDKEPPEVLAPLLPRFQAAVFTRPSSSRLPPAPPEALAAWARGLCGRVEAVAEPGRAFERAVALAGAAGLVCVCGSLYLVGEVRALLGLSP